MEDSVSLHHEIMREGEVRRSRYMENLKEAGGAGGEEEGGDAEVEKLLGDDTDLFDFLL